MKKKWGSLLLAGVLAVNLLAGIPVHAEERMQTETSYISLIQNDTFSEGASTSTLKKYYSNGTKVLSIEDTLYQGLKNREETIDLSRYRISTSDFPTLYKKIVDEHPELFYIGEKFSWSYSNSIVYSAVPTYRADATNAKITAFQEKLDEIVAGVQPGWSDLEKITYFHDYLCLNGAYDSTLSKFSAADILLDGTGVCESYTRAMKCLLDRVGIPSGYAESNAMKHIWNIVQLDGKWYHIDVTWDDPTPDRIGMALHQNFLLSDAQIQQTKHYKWVSDWSCSDSTTFQNAFWKEATTGFVNDSEHWYGLIDNTIYRCDFKKVQLQESLATIQDLWYSSNTSYWTGCYSGLGYYSGSLYCNGPKNVYRYDLANQSVQAVCTYTGTYHLYGFHMQENIIHYIAGPSPNEEAYVEGKYPASTHSHTPSEPTSYTAPTCTKPGFKGQVVCTTCDDLLENERILPALGHQTKQTLVNATLTKDGSVNYHCTRCKQTIGTASTIYYPKTFLLSKTVFTYNGKVQKPSVTVKDRQGKIIPSQNYSLVYSNKNSKSPGTYTINVVFKGNYSGTKTLSYKILPKTPTFSLKKAKKGVTVKWSKCTGASGYIIYRAKGNGKWSKLATIKKGSQTTYTDKKAKKKTTYRYTVQAYTKSGKTTLSSGYLKNGKKIKR